MAPSSFDDLTDEDFFDKLAAEEELRPRPGDGDLQPTDPPPDGEEEEKEVEEAVKPARRSSSNVGAQQLDSDPDFSIGNSAEDGSRDVSAGQQNAHEQENSAASSQQQQQDAQQFYGSATEQTPRVDAAHCSEHEQSTSADADGSQYWEDLYPGWKYDPATGRWYQTEDPQTSHLQQQQSSAESSVARTAEDSETSASNGYYPPNMVFDPQYPEWYYDTDTQQWCTLESYSQAVQSSADIVDDRPSQVAVGSGESYAHAQRQNVWQPDTSSVAGQGGIRSPDVRSANYTDQHSAFRGYHESEGADRFRQFVQPKPEENWQAHVSHGCYGDQNSVGYSGQQFRNATVSNSRFSYPNEGRSSAGRPPHALVTFGFGGKLVILQDGSKDTAGGTVSILSLAEVVMDKAGALSSAGGGDSYFRALCQQSFPGPLVGGNASAKDVNKCMDEKITSCGSSITDARNGQSLRLLLSLLKISCQHYGKIRSPFNSGQSLQETDAAESAVTKLFASATMSDACPREYDSFIHNMHSLPSEGQIQATAMEVQNLLVSGRRKEALQCAQVGQLWGPALLLASQLGEKYYIDTVKQMAKHQFVYGSPLRTLYLLIAGQPADVFSAEDSLNNETLGKILDSWEENLAIITGNRTKDDELVIIHLGDCLWKERGEIIAAHTCYLVAEVNFESYSESARLCLLGADHWKCPRTYYSPEAIQRTEIYEYSKVLGNSQFNLLQFQPYKLVYAYMLAEVGKVSDSLRYCQASLKLLKTSVRIPEVEMLKVLLSSLEERLRIHQNGGYSTDLAPTKLVGKLFTTIDRSIHRMISGPQSPLPPVPQSIKNGNQNYTAALKMSTSQSTMAMSSLVPSASMEGIGDWTGDDIRKNMHTRSASEPDFSKSSRQDRSRDASSVDAQSKVSSSRFGRIGSQFLQRTVEWVSRSQSGRQAKLGESNKFYYDENLKRWVEEGAEPPAEEVAPPPPPTSASLQNVMPYHNIDNASRSPSLAANGPPVTNYPNLQEQSSGIPPISLSPNQFSARARIGVRSRYVDTFNKGGAFSSPNKFQSPSTPSLKPLVGAKFFVPASPATPDEQVLQGGNIHEATAIRDASISPFGVASLSSPLPPPLPCPYGNEEGAAAVSQNSDGLSSLSHLENKPSPFIPTYPSTLHGMNSPPQPHGSNFSDDLHEVQL
ncbi:protein transport protein SEC16B-like protein [Iris pallida]|uniref:Protein transport protein sec16 n=1 Tax=Iris pallida TaxID=29817 RepID=A0AAX6EZ87_IRIPA|nr:protein transport protein SEC16B-like protein [Iris pallida]